MINVLIADDELWIRKWLTKMVGEYSDHINIVDIVDDGDKALKVLENNDIDIVISDIQMQEYTGLELAAIVKKEHINTQFVIISGYDYFDYAKTAIQNNVIGYLLKPLDKTELYETLDGAIKRISEQKNKLNNKVFLDSAIDNLFYKWLIAKDIECMKQISDLFTENELDFKHYIVCTLQMDICQHFEDNLEEQIKSIFRERLNHKHIYIIKRSKYKYYLIICDLKDTHLINENNQFLLRDLKRTYNCIDLNSSMELEELLDISQYVNKVEEEDSKQLDISQDTKLSALESNIILNIKGKKQVELSKELSYVIKLYEEEKLSKLQVKHWLVNTVINLLHYLEGIVSESGNILIKKGHYFIGDTSNYTNILSMFNWIQQYGDEIISAIDKDEVNNVSDIVMKVNNYMLKYYYEDINMTVIVNKYGINPSYFSKKFKEEMGINFVDMLNNIRINASAEMLENTDVTIKKISESCGFKNSRYYSKVFYKYIGLTPTKYRLKHRESRGIS